MTPLAFQLDPTLGAGWRLSGLLDWRHGLALVLAFAASLAVALAQSAPPVPRPSALATLVIWLPFIIRGFLYSTSP